jgi:hypothetical protein
MSASRAFLSFTEVPDPERHGDYNAWHQLDHRPENLALPGVLNGERWVRSPDCAALHRAAAPFDALHYLNMYWFAHPARESVQEWADLAERSLQWGRRPDLAWAHRLLMGFFLPVKGYVHPRILVSPDVLPFRPNRGVYVTVTRVEQPASASADAYFAWCDRVLVPRVVDCDGVAGAWTFASDPALGTPAIAPLAPGIRVHLYFLDDDPLMVAGAIEAALAEETADATAERAELCRGPLRSITPWRWDWFEGST